MRIQPLEHGNGVAVGLDSGEEVDGLSNVVNVLVLPGEVVVWGNVAHLTGDLRRLLEVVAVAVDSDQEQVVLDQGVEVEGGLYLPSCSTCCSPCSHRCPGTACRAHQTCRTQATTAWPPPAC